MSVGNFFSWEQPRRSQMFQLPAIAELYDHAQAAEFDMCEIGCLKDPLNQLHMSRVFFVHERIYITIKLGLCGVGKLAWGRRRA